VIGRGGVPLRHLAVCLGLGVAAWMALGLLLAATR
jgi:hypothetical protein